MGGGGEGADGEGEQGVGDAIGSVAEDVAFGGEVAGDALNAEGLDAIDVGNGDLRAFGGIALTDFWGDGGGVEERVVEEGAAGMLVDALDVLRGGEVQALVGLGHEVADEDAGGLSGAEGFGNAMNQKVSDDAGEEGARANGDEVGAGDGLEGLRRRGRIRRFERELDNALAAGCDFGLAANEGAIFHAGGDGDVGGCSGEDVSTRGKDLGGKTNGLGEVAGHLGEGGDEEVAEVMAAQFGALAEAVTEELGDEALIFGESDHAVAQISRRQHVEIAAEAAAGATVVGDGDYRSEVGNDGSRDGLGEQAGGVRDAELKAAQESGEACSSADSDDAQARGRGGIRSFNAHRNEKERPPTSLNQAPEQKTINRFRGRGAR